MHEKASTHLKFFTTENGDIRSETDRFMRAFVNTVCGKIEKKNKVHVGCAF